MNRDAPSPLAPQISEVGANEKPGTSTGMYDSAMLQEMLLKRDNPTFVEPEGASERVLHSFFPRLTFLLAPLRNAYTRLAFAGVMSIFGLVLALFSAFAFSAGLIGDSTNLIAPAIALSTLIYVLGVWKSAARNIRSYWSQGARQLEAPSIASSVFIAIMLPVTLTTLVKAAPVPESGVFVAQALAETIHSLPLLLTLIVCAFACLWLGPKNLRPRLDLTEAQTDASEAREN